MTRRFFVLFFLLFAVLSLGSLGLRPLGKADESRYAEIPREMAASGDWITPRLNGLKYFEKPPLQYWATAAFFKVFGERDWVARLWVALTGIGGLLAVLVFGNKAFSRPAGNYAALILAGCPLYALMGQINTLDMALAFFLSCAVFAFALGRYYLFWAACALAVLSKGLVGIVLPLATVGLYVFARWDWALLGKMRPLPGAALFLALCAPWFVAVSLRNPEFAHFFFVQEHFQRFTSRMHDRYEPVWYFIPVLAFGVAPWLLPLFFSLKTSLRKSPKPFDPQLFLVLWALVVFVFFSASSSKLPSYVLPILPALALLVGNWLAEAQPRRLLALQCGLAAAAGIALAAAAPWIAARLGAKHELASGYEPWLATAGLWLAAAGILAAALAWRGRIGPAVALLAAGSLGCTLAALAGHRVLAPAYSIASQASAVQEGAPVFAVDIYDHTLPWYLRRPVTMVRYRDELAQAIEWEPHKFIPDLAGFARAWAQAPGAYAVFASHSYDSLQKEIGAPMEIVSRGPRYIIVRKP